MSAMLALAFCPIMWLCAAASRFVHNAGVSNIDMIDHKTIGSGDEPEHTCLTIDPLPSARQRNYLASRASEEDATALFIIQLVTDPND